METNAQRLIKIQEFPEDGALWVIKWIDEFQLPHLGTRSASVGVVLQKLPFTDPAELGLIPPEFLLQILSQKKKQNIHAENLPSAARVMPGTLPLLHIGAVFQNKVKVGELPTQRKRIDILRGEQDGEEVSLDDLRQPPPRWGDGIPYRLLNKFEYSISPYMSRARCFVINVSNATYIIPRMTIFKAFYAPHTELAKAFCNGPWHKRLEDVVCLYEFESGLKTECTSSGQWNVILQTLVPDEYAEIVALLYFDEYARACAESIYSRSLQDRTGRQYNSWYASAQIPFRPLEESLQLDIKGFLLRGWAYNNDDGDYVENRKFLVTEIVGSSWPSYIPDIGFERANSSKSSSNPAVVPGPKPYATSGDQGPSGSDTEVDGEHDAQADSAGTHRSMTEFHWINQPRKTKIPKQSSQRYEGNGAHPRQVESEDKISTGEHTYQQDALPKGQAEVLVRTPEKRFENILEAFKELKSGGNIKSFSVVPCPIPGKLVHRGDLNCWSFIDEYSRVKGFRPRRGWRLVEYDRYNTRKCLYRSALVVRLASASSIHYWIEIECRKRGEVGFRSPVLTNATGNITDIISETMEVIVERGGVRMETALNDVLTKYSVRADCYKHRHKSPDSPKFDAPSVWRFLSGLMHSNH